MKTEYYIQTTAHLRRRLFFREVLGMRLALRSGTDDGVGQNGKEIRTRHPQFR